MREQRALWQMVLERPLSRMARRVYADWLEDHGDPRGEFIQVQCAADSLPCDHPRRHLLEARADDLLRQHEAEWLGPMRGRVRAWQFRRGLLEWVSADADVFLANADEWAATPGLLGVHLRKAGGRLEALAGCPALSRLCGLYLGENDLSGDDLRILLGSPHLGQLRRLYLQCNRLDADAVRSLAGCKSLAGLRDLNLGRNFIGDAGVRALVRSPYLGRLRQLNLLMAGLDLAGIEGLAAWPGLARLPRLSLSSNIGGAGSLAALARSPHFGGLRQLTFSMNDVSDADLQALAAAPQAGSLRQLNLSMSRGLGDGGVAALAGSPHLNGLRELHLGLSAFGNGSLDALRRPAGLRRLRGLNLSGGFSGDVEAVRDFLQGPLVRRLRWLDLESMPVDSRCVRTLARQAPLRLRHLSVNLGGVSASAWEGLLEAGGLRELTELTVNDLPAGGLAAMCAPGRLPALSTLRVLSWAGGVEEAQALAASELLGRLHKLCLAGASEKVRGNSIAALARSPQVANLTHLDLAQTPLGEPAVQALTAGRHWRRLTVLDLAGCRLGAAGVLALAKWPGLAGLRRLSLRSNGIEAAGAAALAASPHVSELLCVALDHSNLSEDDRAALRRRLGGRVAFDWRSTPETIVFGAFPHDDS